MRFYSIVLSLLIVLFFNACSSKDSTFAQSKKTHTMGNKLEARYYPIDKPVIKDFANHTYPEAYDENGNRHAWKALGGDSGGKVLPGTKTHCDKGEKCIDISTVNYIMTQEPCIWPYDGYYAVVGVCWNATNRGLYFTNKTVHNIPHYVVIEKMYGTYGLDTDVGCWHNLHPFKCKEAKKKFAWSKCLKKVKSEMPWEAQTQEIHKSMKSDISPRKKLYLEYVNRSNQKSIKNYEDIYLEKLFELNIQEKLGSISKKKKDQLLKIHKKYKQKNKVAKGLNLKSTKETFNHEKYLDDLNKVINKELKEYKKVLSEQEYKKLFGASKDKKFDIRNTK